MVCGGCWSGTGSGGTYPPGRFDVDRFVDESGRLSGKSYTAAGGFLPDVAAYFGIAPKEAEQMEPQHRLLLEMAVEAVEAVDDAAIDPASLTGSDTGVLIGVCDTSYGVLQMVSPAAATTAYTGCR
ncbi:hypothetical protein HCN51_56110 [Nonomuraea sp. FMUSA5-5]|uniref:Beta-ketoacyl synthase-like N-terminal domain-containing protein n=1 Tax=Nonomuraea composti TaxID=2720023 RepID=A0ABX1BLQ3_9ACTN|nr:beta-ketoacyl synthase N-terminal-like domain-containing protein [Nonomuraea sp. FMUSA5-5]NJP98650.1 hypothetical protein [Nonomuraea sp. FMUSA5-5]